MTRVIPARKKYLSEERKYSIESGRNRILEAYSHFSLFEGNLLGFPMPAKEYVLTMVDKCCSLTFFGYYSSPISTVTSPSTVVWQPSRSGGVMPRLRSLSFIGLTQEPSFTLQRHVPQNPMPPHAASMGMPASRAILRMVSPFFPSTSLFCPATRNVTFGMRKVWIVRRTVASFFWENVAISSRMLNTATTDSF